MSKRAYPLDIENVGGDIYSLMSKGHHAPEEFMRQVRANGYDWPLGMPKHIWLRCIPPPDGYATWYVEAKEGARGAFPATQCWEAYNAETYESITTTAAQAATDKSEDTASLVKCAAARDGDCTHKQCPQLRDNEPRATGRHCPLDTYTEED